MHLFVSSFSVDCMCRMGKSTQHAHQVFVGAVDSICAGMFVYVVFLCQAHTLHEIYVMQQHYNNPELLLLWLLR